MRKLLTVVMGTCLAAVMAFGTGFAQSKRDIPGQFDYYVLALSWSSAWCESTGKQRKDPQCAPGRGLHFVLHGLWPQYEKGWPDYCRTVERDPSRAETESMASVMGGSGYAFYQWKKHGRCSGLSAAKYYELSRQAYHNVTIPEALKTLARRQRVAATDVEAEFLRANPKLKRDQVTVTCKDGRISEVRVCLTKDLEPRRCGADVIRDCRMKDAILEPVL